MLNFNLLNFQVEKMLEEIKSVRSKMKPHCAVNNLESLNRSVLNFLSKKDYCKIFLINERTAYKKTFDWQRVKIF